MQTGPTPSQIRRARRFVVAAMILAWATHLLVAQWASGAGTGPTSLDLVLRQRVEVMGQVVRLADVVHAQDLPSEVARRIVETQRSGEAGGRVEIDQILRTLEEAGIRRADVEVSGALACEVMFLPEASSHPGEGEWADLQQDEAVAVPAAGGGESATDGWRTLADRMRLELARRLDVEPVDLMLEFGQRDAELTSLPGGRARSVLLVRGDDLGRVGWEIELDDEPRLVTADATLAVRQLVAARPVARGQTLQSTDLKQARGTISKLADRAPEAIELIGQTAARALAVGEVITTKKLAPRLLVERGQFVVVRVSRGGVEIRLLARAQEDGGYGQVIRAMNEQTGDALYVTLTGPQAGTMSQPPQ